jgi:MFS family permease
VANTLSVAAVSLIPDSISDLIGRRHVTLLASALACIGCIVVGTAHRIDVAIGGSAITGIGSGLAESVGTAALLELAPGIHGDDALLVDLPFAAALTYAILQKWFWLWALGAHNCTLDVGSIDNMILPLAWSDSDPAFDI